MRTGASSITDEALAYDSLASGDREREWDEVLGTVRRWKAFAFLLAMTLGGLSPQCDADFEEGFEKFRRLPEDRKKVRFKAALRKQIERNKSPQ